MAVDKSAPPTSETSDNVTSVDKKPNRNIKDFGERSRFPLKNLEKITSVRDDLRRDPDARNTFAKLMLALRNARKDSLDGLTALEGRKKFNLTLESAIAQFRQNPDENSLPTQDNGRSQNSQSVTVAVVDLNFLKLFNDGTKYGFNHGVGDEVIKYVAGQLQKNFKRDRDIITARCGGDEFGIVMRDVSREQATSYLEKISQKIRDEASTQCKNADGSSILFNGKPAPISISFGCYEIGKDDLNAEPDNKKLAEKAWAAASVAEATHKIKVKSTMRREFPDFVAAAEKARYESTAGIG